MIRFFCMVFTEEYYYFIENNNKDDPCEKQENLMCENRGVLNERSHY
jgi:hypothetical protein